MKRAFARAFAQCLAAVAIGAALIRPLAAADALKPSDFAASFPLSGIGEGLHAVELSEAVYRAGSQRSLNDLRIFNANGEALPLAVLPPLPAAPPTVRLIELNFAALPAEPKARDAALQAYALRFERDRTRTVIEIHGGDPSPVPSGDTQVGGYLIDARPLKDMGGRLLLRFADSAPDFAGRVQILGSEDLVNWRVLTSGALTHNRRLGDVIEKLRFDLARPPSFLRVTWSGATAPQIAAAGFEEMTAVATVLPRAQLALGIDGDRRSLYVDVPEALPTERLFIRTPQSNDARQVTVFRHVGDPAPRTRRIGVVPRRAPDHWIAVGALDVFRVQRDGADVEGPPLSFPFATDRLRMDAEQPFTDPLPIVEAEWRPARIVFAARAPGPYRLVVGHDAAPAGPLLDVRAVLPADDAAGVRLPLARIDAAAVGSATPATAAASRADRIAAEAHWSRNLLWGVLALAVAGLAWMTWRLAGQLRRPATTPPEAR